MKRPDPVPCTCTTVRRTARILARAYDAALTPAGMNITQLAVMRGVERQVGEPMARVADDLEMDRTTLYRALTPLCKRGWVEIDEGPEARSRTAITTRAGREALADAAPLWDAMQIAIIGKFGRNAWLELVEELQRLQACLPGTTGGKK